MSDTEIRIMRYTIEQLSAELQATRQYVSDIKSKLECARKALKIAVKKAEALKELADIAGFGMFSAGCQDIIEQITALEQKDK